MTAENENSFPPLSCCGGLYTHKAGCPKTTGNEAAERLRNGDGFDNIVTFSNLLDAALAAERRATVERIRARLAGQVAGTTYDVGWVQRILDEEAAR